MRKAVTDNIKISKLLIKLSDLIDEKGNLLSTKIGEYSYDERIYGILVDARSSLRTCVSVLSNLEKQWRLKMNKCDCCDEPIVVKILTLTDGEGVLLDQVHFCNDCWQNREITLHDQTIDY